MKRLVLLGASGSIGKQTVDVVLQHPDLFSVTALSVGRNIDELRRIMKDIPVSQACVQNKEDALMLKNEYPSVSFLYGDEGLCELAGRDDYDVLVNALVGFAGFAPTLTAIETGHDVALANKETLVVGGQLIYDALKKHGRSLYPIDSEHSAIFQCLQGNRHKDVRRLIITASGGAFRNLRRDQLADVKAADALAHPNWSMGDKITIDSATMMNKGFEVTEAHWLFDMDYDRIDVLMHDESVVHSMVEYIDHSVMAQMGAPDMRLPIQYALSWPERFDLAQEEPLDLAAIGTLHFRAPDYERFPLLKLAYDAGRRGGCLDAVMNAANEVANLAFRKDRIPFLMIEDIIISAVTNADYNEVKTVDDLLEADRWGREYAENMIRRKFV